MILTIKGADFSGSGLGTNTSMSISYNGNVSGTPGFIEKNTALTSTITIKTGYTYDSISSVTVGGSAITGYTATDNGNGTVTLTIPANLITGKVVVNVNTTATSGGETGGDSEGDSEQPGTGGDSGSGDNGSTNRTYTIGEKLLFNDMPEVASTFITEAYYSAAEDAPELVKAERSGYKGWKNIRIYAGQTYQLNPNTRLIVFYDDNNQRIEGYNLKNTYSTGIPAAMDVDCWLSVAHTTSDSDSECYITRLT